MTPSCTQNDILKVSKKTQDRHRDRPSISTTKRTYVLTSSRSRTKQNRRKSQMAMIRTTQINSCWRFKSSSGSSRETYSKNTRGTPNIRTASCQSYYTCGLLWYIVNRAKSLHLFLMSFEELTTSSCDLWSFPKPEFGTLEKESWLHIGAVEPERPMEGTITSLKDSAWPSTDSHCSVLKKAMTRFEKYWSL